MIPRRRRVWLILLLGGALAAAAEPGLWLDVPFVKQEKDGCGAASIAMVMRYWDGREGRPHGQSADPARIQRALYSVEAHGIFASQVQRYFQQNGFQTFAFKGAWADLRPQLEKGRPLMVAMKPGGDALHYVVIVGLDSENGPVLLNDPARRKLMKEDRSRFEREWSAAGNWTLLALPEPR